MKQRMNKFLIIMSMTLWTMPVLKAQDTTPRDTLQLGEAVVKGSRVVCRPDGRMVFPSREMTAAASSGYSLLNMLHLPGVKVDDVGESITAANPLTGTVTVRINDVAATAADMRALQPTEVEKVELIDRPGLRYGEGVGIVINIVTRRATAGHVVGAGATFAPKTDMGKGNAHIRANRGADEWSVGYAGYYMRMDGMTGNERTDYLMADGTHRLVERNTHDVILQQTSHELQTRYSRLGTDGTAMVATLSMAFYHAPRNDKKTDVTYADGTHDTQTAANSEKTASPLLDLYMKTNFGPNRNQTVVANATGAYTHTDYAYLFASAPSSFGYRTKGRAYRLQSEAIYENRLRPFTLTAGLRHTQKYVCNDYRGDATLLSQMRTSHLYAFTQMQGAAGRLRYMAGLGLSREYYRQGDLIYDHVWLRPKLNLALPLSRCLNLNYTLTSAPAASKLQNMSGMVITTNEMEVTEGNPQFIMCRRDEHTLTLSLQKPRLYSHLTALYRHNAHPAMQHIRRTDDNRFAKTFIKGRRIDMFLLQAYTNYDLVPERLNAALSAEMLRIANDGRGYSHRLTSFNASGSLTAWLGRWTVMAAVDNGFHFMENEYESRNILSAMLSVAYRWQHLQASLFCQNPFCHNREAERVENHNAMAHKQLVTRNRDTSSVIGIKLTWNLAKGRKYEGIERDTDRLKDTDTGVAKP